MANVFHVGSLEVLALSDGTIVMTPQYFRDVTDEAWEPHRRWLDHEGKLVFSLGCFLVRSGDRRVLIDTGIGPFKGDSFQGGELLSDMASAGVTPEQIDAVFITHLHADHCGSAALRNDGVMSPAFPNATYRWTSAEQTYWSGELPPGSIARRDVFAALAPRYEAVEGGEALAPGVDVVSLPGHTPGHAGIVLSSGDARAFILGDAISCPVQLEEPEWSGMGDVDPKLARRTQEALAREVEGSATLIGASHFPGLRFGRVLMGEGRRYWQAI